MEKNSLTTFTYKDKTNANFITSEYIVYFVLFFLVLFTYGLKLIWLGIPLAITPLYYLFSKGKSKNTTRYEIELIFSTDEIMFANIHYPVSEIEAVAIYIEAFDNFKYATAFRHAGTERRAYNISEGDKNIISFRANGKVIDLSFYLEDYARFCMLRRVINDWIAQGISVVVKQQFDDDFMMEQMSYYGTSSRI